MSGWIKIHRSINNHWLYTEKRAFSKFEAWLDILINVNFAESKVVIKGKLYIVKRGESVLSMDSWAKRWGWDKSRVRRFMELLQKDTMITIKSDNITTHLIVCNYDSYQDERNANKTQTKRKRITNEYQTTPLQEEQEQEEEQEEDKPKGFNFKNSLIKLGVEPLIVKDWLLVRKNKKATNTETAFNIIKKEIEKCNLTPNDCIKLAVEKSWSGFNCEWVKNTTDKKEEGYTLANGTKMSTNFAF